MQRNYVSLCAVATLCAVTSASAQTSSVSWTGKIQTSQAAAGDREGTAIAGSPGYLFFGAPFSSGTVAGTGTVILWTTAFAQRLDTLDASCRELGASLALGLFDLVAGAPGSSGGDGMVKIFENQMGFWGEYQTLQAPVDAWSVGARFGAAVAKSPTAVFVGAPEAGNQVLGTPSPGAVYIFDDNGGVFTFAARIVAPPNQQHFGASVQCSGTRLFVGAPGDPLANTPGSVFVYQWSGGTATLQATLTGTSTSYDGFGTDLAFDSVHLVVGAPADGPAVGARAGRAHLFLANGASWTPDGVLRPTNGADGDGFGQRVALEPPTANQISGRLLVAAPGSDFAGTDSGSVHAFVRNAQRWYNLLAEFAAPETTSGDGFGGDVTFVNGKALVGAPQRADAGPDTGALYAFDVRMPRLHCATQTNSLGCAPAISFEGHPSPNGVSPFVIGATQLLNQKPGFVVYGSNGTQAVPLLGGTLCVKPPIKRAPPQSTGGSTSGPDCSGTFAFDFTAWAQSGADPGIYFGLVFEAQIWTRDPQGPGSNLTNAVEFTWLP